MKQAEKIQQLRLGISSQIETSLQDLFQKLFEKLDDVAFNLGANSEEMLDILQDEWDNFDVSEEYRAWISEAWE